MGIYPHDTTYANDKIPYFASFRRFQTITSSYSYNNQLQVPEVVNCSKLHIVQKFN